MNCKILDPDPEIVSKNMLKFKVRQGKTVYGAIGFNMSQHYEKLIKGVLLTSPV